MECGFASVKAGSADRASGDRCASEGWDDGGHLVISMVERVKQFWDRARGRVARGAGWHASGFGEAWHAVALLLALVFASSACGMGEGAGEPPSPGDVTARVATVLPSEANVVFVVTDGAGQRATPAGRALGAMLVESGALPTEVASAWSSLARALGLSSAAAFDELLGTHAMLVARCDEPWRARGCEWALLSEVSDETAERLRHALAPSPRGVAQGLSVMALEGGRLTLAVGAAGAELRRFGSWGRGSLVLMAPGEAPGLFDQMLPLLRAAVEAAPAGARAEANAISRPDAFLLVRAGAGVGVEAASESLALAVACAGDGWNLRFTGQAAALGLDATAPGVWSFKSLERMGGGAIAAVLASVSREPGRSAIVDGLIGAWPEFASRLGHLNGGMGFLLREVAGANGAGGTLAATLGIKVDDAERFQADGDGACGALALRLQGEGGEMTIDGGAFQGVLGPADIRDVSLDRGVEGVMGAGFGERPVLSWGYALDRERPSGWWVVSVAPGRSQDVEQFRSVLCCGPVASDGKKRVLTGLFRPSRLAERSMVGGAVGAGSDGDLGWLRHVERVSVDAWVRGGAGGKPSGAGWIEGEVELRMREAGARSGVAGRERERR